MENESGSDASSPSSDKKKPCQICGSDDKEYYILTCVFCTNTQHSYCMEKFSYSVPDEWTCELCKSLNRVDDEDSNETSSSEPKKKPCEICGSDENQHKIIICFKCQDTREHIYCTKVMLHSVEDMWLCEACRDTSLSNIVDLAEETANLRINQTVDNQDSQTAPSSTTNQ